ncbi:Hypothetical protein IALB_0504 [Ignavibacterium album JCM 16511]|uniref:DinB-like domain-containing protein n=1 Tax=Ignavibacterium album (strain DSM 19864 / JCM 16511 / NBRC 101810 / Mat9-16) TaxID=945713 RepID=I0AGV9_IGNAJ|nr:DinB family protein [Ignavibacterium album]AFH48216.1 Hypothetical protein IALB_0504 [Ignavibacterium album JCM 16511]
MKQTIKELKEKFISDSELFIKEIDKLYSLTDEQLNWKPAYDVWSIAECVEHLSVTNKLYFNEMEKQFYEEQIICDDSEEIVKHKFFGKMIIKAVDPANVKKTKTFSVFKPEKSSFDNSVIDKLINIQKDLINLISISLNIDFNKYVMSSPASKFIKENFSDVLEIIRLHNQRHLLQINRIVSDKNFPN